MAKKNLATISENLAMTILVGKKYGARFEANLITQMNCHKLLTNFKMSTLGIILFKCYFNAIQRTRVSRERSSRQKWRCNITFLLFSRFEHSSMRRKVHD